MSLIDIENQSKNLLNVSQRITPPLRRMQKSDEAKIVDMLRKTISPMETAGSSLVTTHRVLKGLFEFYSRPGNRYYTIPSVDQEILLGIGVSTFAGLPVEERVAEMRDFIYQKGTRLETCECFLRQALSEAKQMGYKKLYVKIQADFERLKAIYNKLGFITVEDQSVKENNHAKKDFLFRRL